MRKEAVRFAAMWMSMLIIMLPFYSSSVFAAESSVINILSIKGADGISNIRRMQGDYTKLDVEVFSSTPLTAQNIQLKSTSPGSAPITFQTCTDLSPYICTWQSSVGSLPAGAYSYQACIGSCNSCYQTSCKKTTTIYVDGTAPTVDLLTATPTMTNGGKVKLHYRINDRSCLAAVCSNKCSGISKAELYEVADDGSRKFLTAVNATAASCTLEADYDFIASNVQNGERRLCMIAYDMFMQNSTLNMGAGCVMLKKDSTMPSYNAVRLMDPAESYDIKYIAAAGTPAKLVVNLTVSTMFKLVGSQLIANLLSIGGSATDTIPCNDIGNGIWTCSKSLTAKSSASSDIQLSAVDEGGNNNTQTFTFAIQADSAAPSVDLITSGHVYKNNHYLKGGLDQAYAIITETGSGLLGNRVYFGVGSSNRAYCGVLSGKWVCYANITSSGATTIVSVHGEDDAGNMFASTSSMMVDSQAPSLGKVIISNTNSNPYFVTGDDMLVRAEVSDNRAIVDDSGQFSVFMTPKGFADPNPVQASKCEKNETSAWVCEWLIMNTVAGDVEMLFNVSDIVGNEVSEDVSKFYIEYLESATGNVTVLPQASAEVYDVEGQAADYWTSVAGTSMPDFVDSSTTELIEHNVWIPVQLNPRTSATIFSVELAGCSGGDYGNYGKDAVLVRASPKSDRPFARVTLKRGKIEVTEMKFDCALNIISKHKGMISQLEVEKFTASVAVRSHGEVSNAVLSEITRTSQGWLIKATWMESIGKVMDIFTRICGLLASISRAIRDIIGIKAVFVAACENNPFCFPGAQAGRVAASAEAKVGQGAFSALFKFCQYVSCSKTLWGKTLMGDPGFDGAKFDKLNKEGKIDPSELEEAEARAFDKARKKCEGGDQSACSYGSSPEEKDRLIREEYIRNKNLGLSGRMEQAVNDRLQASAPVSEKKKKELETEVERTRTAFDKANTAYTNARLKYDVELNSFNNPTFNCDDNPDDPGCVAAKRRLDELKSIYTKAETNYNKAKAEYEAAMTKLEEASSGGTETAQRYLFGTKTDELASMTEAQRKELGLQQGGFIGGFTAWGNPSNSLILSIATGCIPGIFMNLQKARQIECAYLSCLVNDVPAGMPLVACTKVRNFQWCMFVFGEIFQIIPFAGSIKNILSPVLSLLKDPLTLVFGIFGAVCEFMHTATESTACFFLNSVNSVINIIKTLEEIIKAKDLFNLKGKDSCKETLTKAQGLVQKTTGAAGTTGAASLGAPGGTTPAGTTPGTDTGEPVAGNR